MVEQNVDEEVFLYFKKMFCLYLRNALLKEKKYLIDTVNYFLSEIDLRLAVIT